MELSAGTKLRDIVERNPDLHSGDYEIPNYS